MVKNECLPKEAKMAVRTACFCPFSCMEVRAGYVKRNTYAVGIGYLSVWLHQKEMGSKMNE